MSFDMNSGYSGWSMSKRAETAYDNGYMPKSKWTKAAIIEAVYNYADEERLENPAEYAEAAKKLTLRELRDWFIEYKEWHHTSKFCNATDFYGIRGRIFEDYSLEDFKRAAELKSWEKMRAEKIEKEREKATAILTKVKKSIKENDFIEYAEYKIVCTKCGHVIYLNNNFEKFDPFKYKVISSEYWVWEPYGHVRNREGYIVATNNVFDVVLRAIVRKDVGHALRRHLCRDHSVDYDDTAKYAEWFILATRVTKTVDGFDGEKEAERVKNNCGWSIYKKFTEKLDALLHSQTSEALFLNDSDEQCRMDFSKFYKRFLVKDAFESVLE